MHRIFINGAWVDAGEARTREVANPATLERLGTVPECGAENVARAVAAARAALFEWRAVPAARRSALLGEIAGKIRERKRELAALLTQEGGKPLCESADCIDAAAAVFERCNARAETAARTCGVVAAIVPFNFPLLITAAAVAPAIAAGNTVVLKPPAQNPLASLQLAAACSVLPAGVLNVITGGADTGRALVRHAGVDRVDFTGSAQAGREIAAAARQAELQLGSVDAFIVRGDADLDVTVAGIAWARFRNAGQGCTSGQYVYVERSIAAEFAQRMHQCVGFLDVDDPIKRSTDLGPLISLEAARRVEDQVGRALRAGAKLILGGRRFRPSGLPGHFFQPTILTDVRPAGVPAREEILGPVIRIVPVEDFAQAVRWAGEPGSLFSASVYTNDTQATLKVLESERGGVFRVNDPVSGDAAHAFGGMRHPRLRQALGAERDDSVPALARAAAAQAAAVRAVAAPVLEAKAWWFPYNGRGHE